MDLFILDGADDYAEQRLLIASAASLPHRIRAFSIRSDQRVPQFTQMKF